MTQEEKQLLHNDLCSRLPYGIKINVPHYYEDEDGIITLDAFWIYDIQNGRKEIKPYLRPMSSMTEEERADYHFYCETVWDSAEESYYHYDTFKSIDWLNAHHFDYRGLIEKGLALEAPKDMYKTE